MKLVNNSSNPRPFTGDVAVVRAAPHTGIDHRGSYSYEVKETCKFLIENVEEKVIVIL
jgi:hypothetical protein